MIKKLFYFTLLTLAIVACEPEEDTIAFRLEVQLEPPNAEELPADITITAKNETTGKAYQVVAGNQGIAVFESLSAGFYTLTASSESYNAAKSIELFENTVISMNLVKGTLGNFVIKEVYYSGSTTLAGKSYFSDQFIEIHNNSSDTLYADGLSVTIHAAYGSKENPYAYMAADSIAIQLCYTVPGNGTDHPVAPGKSFVIAQDAINHQSDELGNPNSPVNLADAHFEFYATRYPGKDVDNPAANMLPNLFPYVGTDVMLHSNGGNALALVRIPGKADDYLQGNMIDDKLAKIPNKWVEDAVEIMQPGKSFKRFDMTLDAGLVSVETGSKSGLSIRRKVASDKLNHRLIYQDTNNSSNDFLHDVKPMPWGHE